MRANSPVQIHHYSWMYLLTEALTQRRHRRIEDQEQEWLLGELIRYLEHPSSGAQTLDDMGPAWVEVRDRGRSGSLTRRDPGVVDIAGRWMRLLRYGALRLGADIGEDVRPVWTLRRGMDAAKRTAELAAMLADSGRLGGALRVPNTAGDLEILADLKARQLQVCVELDAPQDRGARARTRWLLDQLPEAPDATVVEVWPKAARAPVAAAAIKEAREDRSLLCPPGTEAAKYRLLLRGEMGLARKNGGRTAGFVEGVLTLTDTFYVGVVQNLRSWRPPAPRKGPTPGDAYEPSDDGSPVAAGTATHAVWGEDDSTPARPGHAHAPPGVDAGQGVPAQDGAG